MLSEIARLSRQCCIHCKADHLFIRPDGQYATATEPAQAKGSAIQELLATAGRLSKPLPN